MSLKTSCSRRIAAIIIEPLETTSRFQCICHNIVGLGGLVVSALGMRTLRPRFESRVAPLFLWVGKLFTHSAVSQLQEIGVQKRLVMVIKCARLS